MSDLKISGADVRRSAEEASWSIDLELVDSERPFGPEARNVPVREVHYEGVAWGFIVDLGIPTGGQTFAAVSELPGDPQWNVVDANVASDDDALDAAARKVVADRLLRAYVQVHGEI